MIDSYFLFAFKLIGNILFTSELMWWILNRRKFLFETNEWPFRYYICSSFISIFETITFLLTVYKKLVSEKLLISTMLFTYCYYCIIYIHTMVMMFNRKISDCIVLKKNNKFTKLNRTYCYNSMVLVVKCIYIYIYILLLDINSEL